jgi:hypothetical protein
MQRGPGRRKRERENGGGPRLESSRRSTGLGICLVVKCYSVVCGLGFLLLPIFSSFFFLFLFLQGAHVYPCFLARYGIVAPCLKHGWVLPRPLEGGQSSRIDLAP